MATANVSPTADQIDPHIAWAARANQLQAERELVHDDDARDRLTDQIGRLHRRIGSTMASTLAGARIQLDVVAQQLTSSELELCMAMATATLDRLAAAMGPAVGQNERATKGRPVRRRTF